MQRPTHTTEAIPPTLVPAGGGWHCSHLYYSFDRRALAQLTSDARAAGSRDLVAALDPVGPDAPYPAASQRSRAAKRPTSA